MIVSGPVSDPNDNHGGLKYLYFAHVIHTEPNISICFREASNHCIRSSKKLQYVCRQDAGELTTKHNARGEKMDFYRIQCLDSVIYHGTTAVLHPHIIAQSFESHGFAQA